MNPLAAALMALFGYKPLPKTTLPPWAGRSHQRHNGKKANNRSAKRAAFLLLFNSKENRLVESMTNWQRHQWAKAGWPKNEIEHFSSLKRNVPLAPEQRIT